MATLHANGPDEAIDRLGLLVSTTKEIPHEKIDRLIATALDVIVECTRSPDGARYVSGMYEIPRIEDVMVGRVLAPRPIWVWQPGSGGTGQHVKVGQWAPWITKQCHLPPVTQTPDV